MKPCETPEAAGSPLAWLLDTKELLTICDAAYFIANP